MGNVGYASKEGERDLARALERLAQSKGVSISTLSLAWLQKKGRDALKGAGIVPIPGTGNPDHMEENAAAVALSYVLSDADMEAIEECVPKSAMEGVDRYGGNFRQNCWDVEKNVTLDAWKGGGAKAPG